MMGEFWLAVSVWGSWHCACHAYCHGLPDRLLMLWWTLSFCYLLSKCKLWFCVRPTRPYVELMNFLLNCGDEAKLWVSQRLRGQCEQHWGALCSSFGTCSRNQSGTLQQTTSTAPSTARWPTTAQAPLQQPTAPDRPEKGSTHKIQTWFPHIWES